MNQSLYLRRAQVLEQSLKRLAALKSFAMTPGQSPKSKAAVKAAIPKQAAVVKHCKMLLDVARKSLN